MHLAEISFAGKVAYNIKDDATKKEILDDLDRKYNVKIITKHFEKFNPDYIHNINNNPHLLCARSNGNQYIMLLTKINLINYCMFIDKKIQQGYFYPRIILVNYHFDDELFKDTLFHGEMITLKDGSWIFIISDLHVYKGIYLKESNLIKRMNIIYEIMDTEYLYDEMDISKIAVKKYFKYDQINELLNDHIPKLPYTCRGIYIKPLFLRFKDILINFNDEIIKKVSRVKYNDKLNSTFLTKGEGAFIKNNIQEYIPETTLIKDIDNTMFLTRKTSQPDIYELFDDKNNIIGLACIPTMKVSKMMRELFTEKNVVDKILLKYNYNDKFKKFIPIVV
jgi:hypothetical protein